MHVPDGFLNAATSVATGAVSVGVIGVSLKKAATHLDDRLAPMAGLVAAFIFALQMLNFPVAAGTSGHLLGGALAAILVGPWVAILCIAIVVLIQALLFADGGITALGSNIVLIAVVPSLVGWYLFRTVHSFMPARKSTVVAASAIAALVTVPAAAAVFTVLFAVGGAASVSFGTVMAAMVGTHVFIGIGEALITAAVISAVVGVRPDLVFGASDLSTTTLLSSPGGAKA